MGAIQPVQPYSQNTAKQQLFCCMGAIQRADMVTHCVYAIQPYNGCMHTTYSAIQPYTIQPGLWDMLTKAIAFEAFQRHRATQLNLRE